jgi:cytochrome c-type biogenesis protein
MIDAPLAVAFTAGLVASVNPCGFAMLPAYVSWYLGSEDGADSPLADRLGPALLVGVTVSAGFVVVFGIAGTLITVGVRSFVDYVPWVALVIGAAIAAVGVTLLAGRSVTLTLPRVPIGERSRRLRSMFVFGTSYAIASLSCTLPVFLAVVASTFTRTDVASGIATFAAYAAGMSAVLLALTIALATARHTLIRRVAVVSRHLNRIAGALLVVAGGYIVYYWTFNLSTDPGTTTGAGPARFVERLSARATGWIHEIGWQTTGLVAAAVVAVAVALVAVTANGRRR